MIICPWCGEQRRGRASFRVCAPCSREFERAKLDHVWRWRQRLPERKGQRCAVLARGKMNSVLVVFADGFQVLTSRWAIKRAI